MQIRTRLTLQFLLSGGVIMIIASLAIYLSSASFRKEDFYNRLINKAKSTANLVFNEREIDVNRVLRIEGDKPVFLQNEKILIIDFKNDIVYNSDENSDIKIRNDVLERVRLGYTVTYRQDLYEVLGTLYFTTYNRYVVIAAATDIDGALHLEKLRKILAVVCLFTFLLFFIVGWFYSVRAIKPISKLVKKVEDISISSLNLRVFEGKGNDEISRLAKTFNKMLERLETSFSMQKDFIANASHELRTPLTAINGQLEVLMMKERSTSEYKLALESVLDDIRSLIDLSNRLLLIARTSAEIPEKLYKEVRLDEILWQAQEEIKKYNSDYSINISIDSSLTDSDQMIIIGDEYLLKVAVTNIIENGCKYSPDHTVDINFQHNNMNIEVIFEDRGIGISKEDLQKVFEPFYRGSNALTYLGSGIGLQLVNQIIKNHNGIIQLTSQIGKGTSVTVMLPSS
ncbi:MAG TPA: HAMP domain-containing sensor histidine kinase [Bacteroidales bacterium]|nr:HAMP domain-containing sensor histidine kinase [Bacteroidales bacterium]